MEKLLGQALSNVPECPGCTEFMQVWLKEFGFWGFLLGNLALFLFGFLFVLALDLLPLQWHSPGLSLVSEAVGIFHMLLKFSFAKPERGLNFLLLLFLAVWLFSGYQLCIAYGTLVLFINIAAISAAGGQSC